MDSEVTNRGRLRAFGLFALRFLGNLAVLVVVFSAVTKLERLYPW